jgi:hypothetical protein
MNDTRLATPAGIKHIKNAFGNADRYFDRKDVPQELKTKKEWAYQGRTIPPKTVPKAILGDYCALDYENFDTLDPMLVKWAAKQVQHFFSFDQTHEFKDKFATAYHRYIGLFCRHAFQKDFIEKPRDDLDSKKWPHSRWPLRDSIIKDHVLHKKIVGIIGYHYTNDITFDVDYHDADARRELFLARCQTFHRELSEFFAGCPWFAEHKIEDIGGCHFRVIVKKMHISFARKQAQEFLCQLDLKYPKLAAIESFTKIEVYPVLKGDGDGTGLRLPLCRGRVSVIDRHLTGPPEQNCIDLIGWIANPERKNIPTKEFMRYLVAHTPEHVNQPAQTKERKQRYSAKNGIGSVGSFKGCYYRKLIEFWSEKIVPGPDTIGIWICASLRALKFEGLDKQDALAWIENRLLSLEDASFSDRLTNDFSELMRVTSLDAKAIWANNGYQARIEESNEKMTLAVAYYNSRGVVLHDSSTWDNIYSCCSFPVEFSEFKDFSFSYDHRRLLKEHLHPVLHVEDVAITYEVARRVILFVHKYPTRELAGNFLPLLCRGLGVQWHKNKNHEVMKMLCWSGMLEVAEHNKWYGPNKAFNQARRYELGDEMTGAFSPCTTNNQGGWGVVSIINTSPWIYADDFPVLQCEATRTNHFKRHLVMNDTS